jgi:hypothetical protein
MARECERCGLPGKKLCDDCRDILEKAAAPRVKPGERSRALKPAEKRERLRGVTIKKMPAKDRRRVEGNGTRALYYATQSRSWVVVYRKGRGHPLRVYRAGLKYNAARRAQAAAKRAGLKYVRVLDHYPRELYLPTTTKGR